LRSADVVRDEHVGPLTMGTEESRVARRWTARRLANGMDTATPEADVDLTAGMQFLAGYEDAIYASCRHALVPLDQSAAQESIHLIEATRLHADVLAGGLTCPAGCPELSVRRGSLSNTPPS